MTVEVGARSGGACLGTITTSLKTTTPLRIPKKIFSLFPPPGRDHHHSRLLSSHDENAEYRIEITIEMNRLEKQTSDVRGGKKKNYGKEENRERERERRERGRERERKERKKRQKGQNWG